MVKEQSRLCFKKGSIKSKILEILSSEFPLTIINIHLKVNEKSRQNIKYHTVYETIKSLENQKVLKKNGSVYLINYDWILKNKNYINKLQLNYARILKKEPLFIGSGDIANAQIFTYGSLEKFDEALKAQGKKTGHASRGLKFIHKLYRIERSIKDATPARGPLPRPPRAG